MERVSAKYSSQLFFEVKMMFHEKRGYFSLQLNHISAASLPETTIIFGYFKDGETELIEVKRLAKGHTAKARI